MHGVECDPTAPRAGMGRGVSGRLEMSLLPVVPWALPQPLSPPKRTCLADPESSPRTKRAHVCKYFLKWKHRDCSWTRFQDGDISSGHEGQWSGENGALQIWRDPSHTASAPEMQAAVRGLVVGGTAARRSTPRWITSALAHVPTQVLVVARELNVEEVVTCVLLWSLPSTTHPRWVGAQISAHPEGKTSGTCLNLSGSSSVKWGQECNSQGCCHDQMT